MRAGQEHSAGAARPRSVAAVVRAAHAGVRAGRALECALCFAAGALLTRAAELSSGVQRGAWWVALACGVLAAGAWWLEHPSELRSTARALDASLRHQGALALAFELEQRRSGSGLGALEELVRVRVLQRLRTREALRAVFPSFFAPVSAAAVAGLALLLAMDRIERRAPAEASDLGTLRAGLERALAAGLERSPDPEAGEDVELQEELNELRALLAASHESPSTGAGWSEMAKEARVRLEGLDRRLVERARRAGPASRVRLDEARVWIDALRTALAAGPAAAAGPLGEGSGEGSLTSAPADGTISRPMAEPAARSTLASPTPLAPALGRQAGSFWPAGYDAVVERWVELSRAAQAGKDR